MHCWRELAVVAGTDGTEGIARAVGRWILMFDNAEQADSRANSNGLGGRFDAHSP
jgi:hypothetical protein